MPTSLAASTTSVPAGTASLWPSIVMLTSGICSHRSDVACVPNGVVLVLLAEMTQGRVDDPPTGVTESAKAAAVLEPVGDSLQGVELNLRAFVGQDPDRKSTRLNSSHGYISYAVFCLKKKNKKI